jgi:trehalose/maltose hydrolase-like predicted phosphorylase
MGGAVPDRDQNAVEALLEPTRDPRWCLNEDRYDVLREAGVEARLAIGNGFIGVRGARGISRGPLWMSWTHSLNWSSWPRTYVAGLFDTPNTEPPVPALVPAPDWLRVRVLLDGQPLMLRAGSLLTHQRTLDFRRGLLLTEWRQRDTFGRTARLRTLRLVSLANRALGLQIVQLEIEDGQAEVTLEAVLEAAGPGLEPVRLEPTASLWRTEQSDKSLAVATAAGLQLEGQTLEPSIHEALKRTWNWTSVAGVPAVFWRLVSLARGDAEPDDTVITRAQVLLERAEQAGWRTVLDDHENAWADRHMCSDIEVEGDERAQTALRFAIYHLNSAANPADDRVSIGARALTGDSYLGHVFWDTEIYLLPFYTVTWPEAARTLLMYRYRTLPGARAKAERLGYRGALYAWESADTGEETTPAEIIDPNGRMIQVLCGTQEQHISADIAYAVWHYWRATGDDRFLLEAGAEILLETARFWASRAVLEADGHYHIRGVIGPDEYHEEIDDNAYTNMMACWNIERGLDVATLLWQRWPERWEALARRLDVTVAEMDQWRDAAEGLITGFDPKTGLIEQFAGYFGLEPIDLSLYQERTAPMDVVLGRKRTQASQVVKQADVVALLALLPETFSRDVQETNFRYYEPRCGHGSSLSRGMHALVAARLGNIPLAAQYFADTAGTDLDEPAAVSAGGVRIAAQGALWQVAIFGFAGLSLEDDGIALNPQLPPDWASLGFRTHWRDRLVHLRLTRATRTVAATLERGEPLSLRVNGATLELHPGETLQAEW